MAGAPESLSRVAKSSLKSLLVRTAEALSDSLVNSILGTGECDDMPEEQNSPPSSPEDSSVIRSGLGSEVQALTQYVAKEDELVRKNLLLLDENRNDFDLTIQCRGDCWRVHRLIVCSRSEYLRKKDVANQHKPCLILHDFHLTKIRMDLYLLWTYTYKFPLLSRWIEQQCPEEELEATLEILAWAVHVEHEPTLLNEARTAVNDLIDNKLWLLTDDQLGSDIESGPARAQARNNLDRCLEAFFEQETKSPQLDGMRHSLMVRLFEKAGQLLPKHQWLNQWIGRSPAFKAEFVNTRKELIDENKLVERPMKREKGCKNAEKQEGTDATIEESHKWCESFECSEWKTRPQSQEPEIVTTEPPRRGRPVLKLRPQTPAHPSVKRVTFVQDTSWTLGNAEQDPQQWDDKPADPSPRVSRIAGEGQQADDDSGYSGNSGGVPRLMGEEVEVEDMYGP